jgi:hypothetical protein
MSRMMIPGSVPPKTRRFAIRPPQGRWFFASAVVLIIISVGIWFGLPVYRQQSVVSDLKRLGGTFQTIPGGPRSLRDWIGNERMMGFDTIEFVHLTDTRVTDADVAGLGRIMSLRGVFLGNTPVTDAGLAHLKGLTNVEWLWLDGTQVTDAGLFHLNGFTKLWRLQLEGTLVTDAGLAHLKGLTNLNRVWLRGTQVTDAGVADLRAALVSAIIEK